TLLERSSLQIERQVKADAWRFDETDHLGHHILEIAVRADEIGLRKPLFQIADQFFRLIAHQNSADTLVACGHQHGAERRLADGETNIRVLAALLVSLWSHSQNLGRSLIETAAGIVTGIIDGVGYADFRRIKCGPYLPCTMRIGIGF